MADVLVIGGTGPTGPPVLEGLVERGHRVTVFHTGRHEVPEAPELPHLHGDPFSAEGVVTALGDRTFDTVVATYGRVRTIADHLAHRCGQLVVVGGVPVYRGYVNPGSVHPYGLRLPVREDAARVAPDEPRFAGYNTGPIRATEDHVLGLGEQGAFRATYLRYPTIYGPRNPYAWEWNIVRRVLDGRPWMMLADGGHGIHTRAAARNAAQAVLSVVDRPEAAAGRAYNVADDELLTVRQWVQLVSALTGRELEILSVPRELPSPGLAVSAFGGQEVSTCVLDTGALRTDLDHRNPVTVEEGLAETVEWMLAHADELRAVGTTDPFDYAAEDRLAEHWERALDALQAVAEPFGTGIGRMAMVQTAGGVKGTPSPAGP